MKRLKTPELCVVVSFDAEDEVCVEAVALMLRPRRRLELLFGRALVRRWR